MCICVNCRHINHCQTYFFINKQHKKNFNINYNNLTINFIPVQTIVQVNINYQLNFVIIEWDLTECLSFTEKPGAWLR